MQMLSGFSPSLLKLAATGVPVFSKEDKPVKSAVNPYGTFRRLIDDERYDSVRVALDTIYEGSLVAYDFKPPSVTINRKFNTAVSIDTCMSEGREVVGITASLQ